MQKLKKALKECPALMPVDYALESGIYLAVDTSHKAIGYYIYQKDPGTGKPRFAKFGSITMNGRERRFSQPKRELFGLMRAL